MAEADERQRALEVAYRYLGHRERSEAELRRHLERKAVETAVIEGVLATLRDQGYVDDPRFARHYAEDRRTLDAWGAERIERGLRGAGVAPDVVAEAVARDEPEAELDAALELLRRRHPEAPRDAAGRRRALGLLVRRGYELELAHDALRRHERGAAA